MNSPTKKTLILLALSEISLGNFFEFLMERSQMFKFVLCGDGGLSEAHVARHSSPIPLVYVIISMVANHAPSMPILNQFLDGSMSINLAFQLLSDKTLKSSYNDM